MHELGGSGERGWSSEELPQGRAVRVVDQSSQGAGGRLWMLDAEESPDAGCREPGAGGRGLGAGGRGSGAGL